MVSGVTMCTDADGFIARQRQHWETTLETNPQMNGDDPNKPGRYDGSRFIGGKPPQYLTLERVRDVML
jgi:hypothetical protein